MFFSIEFFLVYGSIFGSAVTHTLQEICGVTLACLFEVFTGLWLSTPTFCMKGYDYVKHFVRVLVLLVINTGCLKQILKNGEHYIVDFQLNLCQTPYKCVPRRQFVLNMFGNLCSSFLAIFLKHPV